jgi:hypothetical protein
MRPWLRFLEQSYHVRIAFLRMLGQTLESYIALLFFSVGLLIFIKIQHFLALIAFQVDQF